MRFPCVPDICCHHGTMWLTLKNNSTPTQDEALYLVDDFTGDGLCYQRTCTCSSLNVCNRGRSRRILDWLISRLYCSSTTIPGIILRRRPGIPYVNLAMHLAPGTFCQPITITSISRITTFVENPSQINQTWSRHSQSSLYSGHLIFIIRAWSS